MSEQNKIDYFSLLESIKVDFEGYKSGLDGGMRDGYYYYFNLRYKAREPVSRYKHFPEYLAKYEFLDEDCDTIYTMAHQVLWVIDVVGHQVTVCDRNLNQAVIFSNLYPNDIYEKLNTRDKNNKFIPKKIFCIGGLIPNFNSKETRLLCTPKGIKILEPHSRDFLVTNFFESKLFELTAANSKMYNLITSSDDNVTDRLAARKI